MSIYEPINRYFGVPPAFAYAMGPVRDLAERVRAVYWTNRAATLPMIDFDADDLVRFAENAGFRSIRLDLEVKVMPTEPLAWEVYMERAPNPLAPTVAEAIDQVLTADERQRYAAHLRPLVESGEGTRRTAAAYLQAIKR
jgi:hypothetical protein